MLQGEGREDVTLARRGRGLITEKFFQMLAGGLFAGIGGGALPLAFDHLEPFAVVGHVFIENRFGAAVAALMGESGFVADTVEANLEIGAAFMAGLRPAGLPRKGEFPATFVAMAREHGGILLNRLQCSTRSWSRFRPGVPFLRARFKVICSGL